MLYQLPDTIQTFSRQSKKTISSLIKDIKADKAQIASLVSNIRDFDFQANYSPALAVRYSAMNVEGVIEFFRDSSLRVGQFYTASSSISNVINSIVSIFSSEIEKVEKDIKYLENFIENFQFIIGEDDLFNFNYIENFDNDLKSSSSEQGTVIKTDRDGINFSENGNYYIDPVLSKMSIAEGKNFVNLLGNYSVDEYISNFSQEEYVTTDTGIDLALNESLLDSWTVTVKSPYMISSQIPDLNKYVSYDTSLIRGAQIKSSISFNAPYESDFIRITPSGSVGLQVLQVIVEGTSFNTTESTLSTAGEHISAPVLSSPLMINGPVDVLFPKMFVSKITFIFNQSKYTRSENTPIIQEANSKFLSKIINEARRKRNEHPSKNQDLVYFYFKKAADIQRSRTSKNNYTEVYSYRYPVETGKPATKVSDKISSNTDEEVIYRSFEIVDEKNTNVISNIVQSVVQHAIDSRSNFFGSNVYRSVITDSFGNKLTRMRSDGIIPEKNENHTMDLYFQKEDPHAPSVSSIDITKYLNTRETTNLYEYSFSVKNIQLGLTVVGNSSKACFVSSRIDTNGAPVAIKGIVNKVIERKNLNYFKYDLKEPGSYELSISMKDVINSEDDWIALATNNNLDVDSEVLFFDNALNAKLRFYPIVDSIKVYKNGIFDNPNNWTYSQIGNEIRYTGQIDQNAIYAVSYSIDNITYDQRVIDLDLAADSSVLIQSFYEDGNPGEAFSSTDSGNRITLTKTPYIEDRFSGAYYNDIYGTVCVGSNSGYEPISVVFDDGSKAINLTNYTSNSFVKAPFYSTSEYLFYQSGRDLIFNKNIDKSFRVLYKFLPSNLRFRIIIRNNIPDQTGNISIDNVVLKCKVKNLDPLSDKLLRLK